MLRGTVTAKELVDEMIEEIDVSLPKIKRNQYYDWINAELFRIYSFAVKCIGVNEYKAENLAIDLAMPYFDDDVDLGIGFDPDNTEKVENINCNLDIDTVTYEDVYKVYSVSNNEYVRSTYGSLMPKGKYFYYKNNGKLVVNHYESNGVYRVMFYMRPKKVTEENADTYIIPLPDGFLDVLRAEIRRQTFMISGNIAMANAWSDQHMILFDILKKWHNEKEADYIR